MAAQDEHAAVSSNCCAQIKKIGQNPTCLCAVMPSNTAKSSGAKPEIAVTLHFLNAATLLIAPLVINVEVRILH
ncbi:hypothetical protein GIB67_007690 [Kingdonia uniflora]|uniref:Bifunctional inhibitor/plant lipid transfer protein/seed storage helical domain-containing protein n=1 Tax=Kingdonia uniflora TaxID=39325 RepID=A0A7J7N1I0_9MAGN|nr:hypothetical protein GIB67_007690 [Kingdonia uniflora]